MSKVNQQGFHKGKLGAITYYQRRGVTYAKLSQGNNPSNTQAQSKQRSRFKVALQALGPFSPAFKIGFDRAAKAGQTGYNAALSYNMARAMQQTENGWEMDWPLVAISYGSNPKPYNSRIEASDDGYMVVWERDESNDTGINDEVFLVLYNMDKKHVTIINAGRRFNECCQIAYPKPGDKDTVIAWIFTRKPDTNIVSDSEFLDFPPCE